ncbi:ATP-binding cassette domain-containing protein [Nakamurella flava]|uniref:ATP-binding cassette domain-containing protein n=1 Tax=Nakamurella flava TaxID=2576308 RepID=A0A4U6QG58_9ACTN|nr:ATP-binding cassette domain-containing protein [Nakamurella flava]TKV59213.1 ATP-binding cassette domain-containing protein [Nakamurella flava]
MFHRRLIALARGLLGPIALGVLLGVLISATYVAQALLLVVALTAIGAGDQQRAVLALAGVVAAVAVRAGLLWAREVAAAWAGGQVRARLRDRLLLQVADLGPTFVAQGRVGATRATVVEGVDALEGYYSRYLPQVVVTALVPIVLVAALFTVQPAAATVLAVAVGLALVVPRFKDATLLRSGRERWTTWLDINADYLEAMQGLPTLRSAGADRRRRDGLQTRSTALYVDTMRELRISLLENGFSMFVQQAGTAGAVVVTVVAVTGVVPAAAASTVLLVLLGAVECFRPVRDLTRAWHAGYLGLTAVDGLDALLSARPAVTDTGRRDLPSGSTGTAPPTIALRGVEYTFPGADSPVLRDVTFTVPAGSTVAVVGRSGAGKSTLVGLLTREIDPDRGEIHWDGIALPALRRPALRAGTAVVGQHPYLFAQSVADNLRLGAPTASDEEIVAAARAADADAFVRDLPDGYDTVLAEGGRSLSGGQRQRLALARALVRRSPLLVLDEATSAVDTVSEQAVVAGLRAARSASGDRPTCVLVVHRLATALTAEQVVVLDAGRVVQTGPPAELAAAPGPFADLLDAQQGEPAGAVLR